MITRGMMSSDRCDWGTPQDLFDRLNEEFRFTLDPCADRYNHKCDRFFTKEDDGLAHSWAGEVVFCNPPYGKELPKWVRKCHDESRHASVVMLIPAWTDTSWFHKWIYGKAEIRFIRGRIRFEGASRGSPFPSMVVVFRNREEAEDG